MTKAAQEFCGLLYSEDSKIYGKDASSLAAIIAAHAAQPAPWMERAAQDTKAWLKQHLDAAILVGELADTDVAYIVDLAEMGFRESFIRHAPQPAPDVAALVERLRNEIELLSTFEPERTNLVQLLVDAIAALTAASDQLAQAQARIAVLEVQLETEVREHHKAQAEVARLKEGTT
jgi:hypothetical protein